MRLYYHKTDGGAEYLMNTFHVCPNGHKEGAFTDDTKYVIRIDGNIEEDAELIVHSLETIDDVSKTIASSIWNEQRDGGEDLDEDEISRIIRKGLKKFNASRQIKS